MLYHIFVYSFMCSRNRQLEMLQGWMGWSCCVIERTLTAADYCYNFIYQKFCKCHRASPVGVGKTREWEGGRNPLACGNTQCNGAAKVQVTVSKAFHGYRNHLLNCACRTGQTYPSIRFSSTLNGGTTTTIIPLRLWHPLLEQVEYIQVIWHILDWFIAKCFHF